MKSDSLMIVRARRKFIYEGASDLMCVSKAKCTTRYQFSVEFLVEKFTWRPLYQNQMSEIISPPASSFTIQWLWDHSIFAMYIIENKYICCWLIK